RTCDEIAGQRPAVTVEQLAALGRQEDAMLLVALGTRLEARMTYDLQPHQPRPEGEERQQQTGRSHQHPTLAHFRVGQSPSMERRFTRTAGPSLARCGGAAGPIRHPSSGFRAEAQFPARARAVASGTMARDALSANPRSVGRSGLPSAGASAARNSDGNATTCLG